MNVCSICLSTLNRSKIGICSSNKATFDLDFGEGIIGAAKDNIKGFYENQAIVDLNEKILNSQGLDWFNANNLDLQTIQESFYVEAERIIEKEYSSENPVILKDPTVCFLILSGKRYSTLNLIFFMLW